MSQEEEKLIEEFKNYEFYKFPKGITKIIDMFRWDSIKMEVDIKEIIHEAYRIGKLAGFEMWEELADKFLKSLFGKKDIHAMAYFTVNYIKSLIEEEKKKL